MIKAPVEHSPERNHVGRLSLAYRAASATLITLGLFWIVWMSFEREWLLVFINFCYLSAGIFLWKCISDGQLRSGAALAHFLLFFVIVEICLIYDVPSEAAPRTTHIYLLAMAFLLYVTFRKTHPAITYAVISIYLGCFVIFSSTVFALPNADPLPDDVRLVGGWISSATALAITCACVYILQSDFATRSSYGRQLLAALSGNQFELYYQPQVGLSGEMTGAEALIRWNHPTRGMVQPGEFVHAAEDLGIMPIIGTWVIEAACRQLSVWQSDPRMGDLKLSINVSPQQFRDEEFVTRLKAIVARHHVDPTRLQLELTEGMVVSDIEDVIAKMTAIAGFGITLSLDDFGTGYSSLKYLKRMPFAAVKIDQAFVRDMLDEERDAAIVKGIIQIGRDLHLKVTAEGVETEAQRRYLARLGCTSFQGYLFGRPQPADQLRLLSLQSCAA